MKNGKNESKIKLAYKTKLGKCFTGKIEDAFTDKSFDKYKGKINLILTSPPFPLNRKKKYGNLNGEQYVKWLSSITSKLKKFLAEDGSLVIEIGNSWGENEPTMSTLPIETLLAIKGKKKLKLCQQFIWFNPAKLPSPVQWVNVERIRVKDSFTYIWWLSKSANPKANNKNVLEEYSKAMKYLLKNKKYNHGLRPSEHLIGKDSFFRNNGGAIPSNVLVGANTSSNSSYLNYCRENQISPHPARMPEFVVKFFINFLTEKNDLILDPFAGSNTTGFVSEMLGRKWVSVEVQSEYNLTSKERF